MESATATTVTAVAGIAAVMTMTALRLKRAESRRRQIHEERMAAIAKGVPLPEDVEPDGDPVWGSGGRQPALSGTILTTLGLGLLTAARLVPRADLPVDQREVLAHLEIWAYPFTFVGVGLLVFAFFVRRRKR